MAARLGYVVRFVGSLGPAVDFYGGVLGLTLTKRT
jgi:catechol 2,3-dioxygenase-like lactoylglutathione lyase family enzyme